MRCLPVPCPVALSAFCIPDSEFCIGPWGAVRTARQGRHSTEPMPKHTGHGTLDTARPAMNRVAAACAPTREQGRGQTRGPPVPRGCLAWEHRRGRPQFDPPFLSPPSCNGPTEPACDREVPVAQMNRRNMEPLLLSRGIRAVVIVVELRVPRARVPSSPFFTSRGSHWVQRPCFATATAAETTGKARP